MDSLLKDNSYWNCSYDGLIREIDANNVISFDIFDTLVMRKTLFPRDIFGIVGHFFAEYVKCDFANIRYESEVELNDKKTPFFLSDIYSKIHERNPDLSNEILKKMMDKELEAECNYIIRREDVYSAFEYAKSRGKKVFLCSDMYFNKTQMTLILNKCGIEGYEDILISSEVGKTKAEGELFQELRKLAGDEAEILHVGDNTKSDYENALGNGMNSYLVWSAHEMLLHSSGAHLLSYAVSLKDNIMLGLFLAQAFNSPFALSSSKGYLQIKNREEIGYLCFAPVLCSFMEWFSEKAEYSGHDTIILFSARDGWLVKKLYDKFQINRPNIEPKSLYFMTSRRAVSVSAVCDKTDIKLIWDMTNAPLTLHDFFETKYGIKYENSKNGMEDNVLKERAYVEELLERHEDIILNNSQKERDNYHIYLQNEKIDKYAKVILFDLLSSGTVPYYLKKLFRELHINSPIENICFATANLPNRLVKSVEDIESFWGNEYFYQPTTKVVKYYQLLESILTAPFPQLLCFDEEGLPVYSDSGYNEKIFQDVKDIQDGILLYSEEYMKYVPEGTGYGNKELIDNMFALIESKYSFVSKDVKKAFFFESASENVKLHEIWEELVQ